MQAKINLQSFKSTPDSLKQHLKAVDRKRSLGAPDMHKDKKGGIPTTHLKSRDEVEILKENFELTDIWRVLNPDPTRFTWRRKNPEIQCRLEFFHISNTLCPVINNAEILPGYRTQ